MPKNVAGGKKMQVTFKFLDGSVRVFKITNENGKVEFLEVIKYKEIKEDSIAKDLLRGIETNERQRQNRNN